MQIKKIAEILKVEIEQVEEAIQTLANSKQGTGLAVVTNGDEVELGTNKEANIFLESLRKEELNKSLSKAALETLSIILYKGGTGKGLTRSEIDYIRGVNSSFIIRALMVRGLVEKDGEGGGRPAYRPSLATLEYMGVTNVTELPRYTEVVEDLQKALIGEKESHE